MDMAQDAGEAGIPWYTVSAAQTIEQVEAEIYAAVQATLAKVQSGKPLGKMWQVGQYEL